MNSKYQFFITSVSDFVFYNNTKKKTYVFGNNSQSQLTIQNNKQNINIPTPILDFRISGRLKYVRGGGYHVMMVTNENRIYSCGYNNYGQLTLGHRNNQSLAQLVKLQNRDKHPDLLDIDVGFHHNIFLLKNVTLVSGWNSNGQLGIGNNIDQLNSKVLNFSHKIREVKCGGTSSVILTQQGELYKAGSIHNDISTFIFTLLKPPTKNFFAKKIFAGCYHFFAMTTHGLYGIGQNYNDQMFVNNESILNFNVEIFANLKLIDVSNILQNFSFKFTDIKDIACGHYHSLILLKNGSVIASGVAKNFGHVQSISTKKICKMQESGIVQIHCGEVSTYMISSSGKLFVAGNNTFGQLGLKEEIETESKGVLGKDFINVIENKNVKYLAWNCIGDGGSEFKRKLFFNKKFKDLYVFL